MLERLKALGLEDKEARVYIAVLELGEASVRQLAEATGVGRTNTYDVVDRLLSRGLVSQVGTGSPDRKVVVAVDPQRLIEKWEEQRRHLDELVPDLRALHSNSAMTRPRVRFFEGAEGILNALSAILREGSSSLVGVLSMRDLLAVPGEIAMKEFITRRIRQGAKLRVVRSRQKETEPVWATEPGALREVRYAPPDRIFTMTMLISDDAVALLSSRRENFALTIQSAEYADLQRSLFEVLWDASSPT